jgi:hypothetical protein
MERLVTCTCGHEIGQHTADGCNAQHARHNPCACGRDAYGVIDRVLVVDDEARRLELDLPLVARHEPASRN